ncbi:MAG TPA: ABC transporter ATP-binding protein [Alphaproteobacteria bacterium]|nr:ABC transporter ATP-binding protein [Alphaproteobacteria bacterium]
MAFKDTPVVVLSRMTWKYGNKKLILSYIVLFSIANIIALFQPLVIGYILNSIQQTGVTDLNLTSIILALSLLVVMTVVNWALHGPARYLERKNAFIAEANYRSYLLRGVLMMPAAWHASNHSGDVIDKIHIATDALYKYSDSTFDIISVIIRFVGSYIALIYFNIHASYIVFILFLLTLAIIIHYDRRLFPHNLVLIKNQNELSAKIYDSIGNIMTIIIMRVEKIVSNSLYQKITSKFNTYKESVRINEVKWFFVSMCGSLMMFIVLLTYILIEHYAGREILVGTLFMLYGYLDRINGVYSYFAAKYSDIARLSTNMINAEELAKKFADRKASGSNLPLKWKEMQLKSMNFSYHPEKGKDLHLKKISMNIKKGEKIAFIGASGSGKTTMLKIIIDLYTPNDINLSVDSMPLEGGFGDISENILLIPQDPELFNTTIYENITMGKNYHRKYVKKAVDIARFSDVVKRLPKRYQSSIMERGVNLSGGEKQRLALARGILLFKDKEILLLDEPTSSIDSRNEMAIYENIFREFKSKTVISSIHRLHLLPLFDKIYYFEKGRIIAHGSFSTMMNNLKFKKMWKKYTLTHKTSAKKGLHLN